MKITIQSIKFDTTEKLEEYIEKKVGKLERFTEAETAEVVLKITKPQTANNKEVAIMIDGLHAEKVADTFEDAIDGAIDALKTQIEKKKNK
ncbi:MAG: ribosome-associated translation inhibitor RaiA [Bacteroidales bacterium]|nr:ribosome-associated translation inhibitor RaiA [Bacteroidales bacterium]